jgi:hypothetical protein
MLERAQATGQSASIVNLSSGASTIKSAPNRYVYGATKAAVLGLTKAVALDFVARGVRCNAICPGTVRSPSWEARVEELGGKVGGKDKAMEMFVSRQPMGRVGEPEEIAALAVIWPPTNPPLPPASPFPSTEAGACDFRNAQCTRRAAIFLAVFGVLGFFMPGILMLHRRRLALAGGSCRHRLHRRLLPRLLAARPLSGAEEGLMRVLVTGAAGMIGRKLVARLVEATARSAGGRSRRSTCMTSCPWSRSRSLPSMSASMSAICPNPARRSA